MPRLIQCLQKVTKKVETVDKNGKPKKVDVFDHEMKRGMIAVANDKLRTRTMTVQEAEAETITELRDRAHEDIAAVDAALKAQAPAAKMAAPRRPVDRETKTNEAFARMRQHPDKALLMAQRIYADYQRVRAETMSMLSALPPGSKDESKDLRKVRAFAELDALVKALPPEVASVIYGNTETLAKLRSTDASIGTFLAKKIDSIDREMEKYFKKVYLAKVESLLDKRKPRKTSAGVKKSTIGADAQDVIDRATVYAEMSGEEIAKRYQEIEALLEKGVADIDEESKLLMEQHELASFGALKDMSAGQLDAALRELQDTVKNGQASWGPKEEARLADQRLKAAQFVASLPPSTESGVAARNAMKIRNWIKTYARNHTSFVQIIERLFPGAPFNSQWTATAIKADQSDQAYVRDVNKRFFDRIGMAAGTKSQWKIGGILEDMRKRKFIPVPDGGKASKNEAIQFLFMWGQPRVQERMRLHGWTDAHIKALKDATSDPVTQAIMGFMQVAYEEIYQKANPIHVSQYGMNLARIEGPYAPARHRAAGAATHMTVTGLGASSGITPSSLKARVEHSRELLQVDALDVFREHLLQMSHWIHFAPFIRETRGVLGNPTVKRSLEMQIGEDGVSDLQKQLDAITRGGVARAQDVTGTNVMIDFFTRGLAVTSMAFNAATAVIQGDSVLRFLTAIPMQRWGNALLMHQWAGKVSMAWKSDAIQNRVMEGMNPAMQAAMKSNRLTPSLLLQSVNLGFAHIRYTDAALTSVSAAIVYTDAINQGMTEEQALQKMDEAVARFSQPTLSVAKSQGLLLGGTASRMLLMFMADPVLKTSLMAEGAMNVARGIKNKDLALIEKGVRSIVAVEIWALFSQTLMSIWASLFSDDDDEDIWTLPKFGRALAMAPFQGWFIAGNFFEGFIRKLAGEKVFSPQTPMGRISQNLQRGGDWWEDLMLLDPTDPDFRKAFEGAMDTVGGLAGPAAVIPAAAKQTSKAAGAVENFREDL